MSKAILVTGATGNQGGAVLDALIKQNNGDFVILALTRNASSPSAAKLSAKSKSVHVLQGDMDKPDLIFPEAKKVAGMPVWGVFMVQSVIAGGVTAAMEETQGKNFIDACVSNGVKHLVYSSVDRGGDVKSLQDPTPISVFASKHRIEQHLFAAAPASASASATGMTWFVLRPTGLIEPAVRDDMQGKIVRTSWKVYMRGDRPLQYISTRDVGHFAAQGFLQPERWAGKCLSLAAWEGSYAQANAVNRAVTGQDFSLTNGLLTRFICGFVYKDLSVSYKWYNENGFGADVAELKRMHPGLRSLEDCLREQS